MKVGILSLNIYEKDNNWGSVLQSWALQKSLKEMGVDAYVINYKPSIMTHNTARYPVLYSIKRGKLNFLCHLLLDICQSVDYLKRDNKFRKFIDSNYITTPFYDENNIELLNMDGYVVGSDIVWNEQFWNGYDKAFFCDYGCMKQKMNIAYAPSMGANFSPTLEQELPRLLSNFKALSLREASQVKYLQNFTNIPVENVIDPTLLLNAQEYEKFILPNLDTPYILVYCVAQNNELIRMATEYAKRNKLKTIVIKCCPTGKNHHIKGLENKNDVGIEEWLTYIKNANYVFTTSYHVCIFSILFKKQFCAVYDDFGKSKIVNLLSMFHINNHADNVADAFNRIDEINYNEIDAILEYERKKSLNFLRINIEALGV